MKKRIDRAKVSFFFSSALLLFGYGVAVGVYEIFPYGILDFGFNSVQEAWNDRFHVTRLRPDKHLEVARHPGSGVTQASEEEMAQGYTLISAFVEDRNQLTLIRPNGEEVARWPVRYTRLFPDGRHLEDHGYANPRDWGTDIHGALILPDGSVVFNFEYRGMVKLDRCGEVQWTLPEMTHHSIDLASDGSFWVGGRRRVREPNPYPPIVTPYLDDAVMRVSPEGELLSEFSVVGLFFKNDLQSLLLATGRQRVSDRDHREAVHLNDIEELSPEFAEAFPMFEEGDLLLSLRQLNLIMVVDPETEVIKWHRTGPYIRQHDPDYRADGTISVFDNNVDDQNGAVFGGSRIVLVDPAEETAGFLYGTEEGKKMYTRVRGKHQNLWNGNMLIVESLAGRIFEVDPDGDLVWEFINRYDEDEVARINDALRYPEEYFTVTNWDCG